MRYNLRYIGLNSDFTIEFAIFNIKEKSFLNFIPIEKRYFYNQMIPRICNAARRKMIVLPSIKVVQKI